MATGLKGAFVESVGDVAPAVLADAIAAEGQLWATVNGDDLPYPVVVRLGRVDGRLCLTGLWLGVDEPHREISTRSIRELKLSAVLGSLAWELEHTPRAKEARRLLDATPRVGTDIRRNPGRAGRPDVFYDDFARRWTEQAESVVAGPADSLAALYDVSPSQVYRWRQEAVRRGSFGVD